MLKKKEAIRISPELPWPAPGTNKETCYLASGIHRIPGLDTSVFA